MAPGTGGTGTIGGGPREIHPGLIAALLAQAQGGAGAGAGAAGAGGTAAVPPGPPPAGVTTSGRIGAPAPMPPTFGPGGLMGPTSRGKVPNAPGSTATFGGGSLQRPPIVDTSAGAGGSAGGGFKGGGMLATSGTVPDRATGGAGTAATKPTGSGARTGGNAGGAGTGTGASGRTYGGYTSAQLLANPALVQRLGPHAAAAWAADQAAAAAPGQGGAGAGAGAGAGGTTTPTTPPTPTQPPASPFVPTASPPSSPGAPGAPGGGGGGSQYPPWLGPADGGSFDPWAAFYDNAPQPYAFDDPFNQILSLLPVMDLNAKKQLAGSMADAGFSGTRYGSAAMRKAAEVGSENALQQNAMMNQVLSDYANRSQDRALQATGQGTNLAALLDAIRRGQINTLADVGGMEQGRQDQFSNTAFQDWSQNRLGYLPLLLQAAMSRHAGSPGGTIAVPQAGKPSTLDTWGPILGGLLGGLV